MDNIMQNDLVIWILQFALIFIAVILGVCAVKLAKSWKAYKMRRDYGIAPTDLTKAEIAQANADSGNAQAVANGLMFAAANSTVDTNIRNLRHLQAYGESKLAFDLSEKSTDNNI